MKKRKLIVLCFSVVVLLTGSQSMAAVEDSIEKARSLVEKEDVTMEAYEEMATDLEEAIDNNPDSEKIPEARLMMARLKIESGHYQQAADVLELLREKKPEGVSKRDIFPILVLAWHGKGNYEKAVELTNLILENERYQEHPLSARAIYQTAFNQETVLRNYGKAAELYGILMDEYPDYKHSPDAAFRAAYLLEREVKDIKEAVQTYVTIAEEYPDHKTNPALNPNANTGFLAGLRGMNLAGVLNNNPDKKVGLADYEWQESICEKLAEIYPERRVMLYEHMVGSAMMEYKKKKIKNDEDGKKADIEGALEWAQKTLDVDENSEKALRVMASHADENREEFIVRFLQLPETTPEEVTDFAREVDDLEGIEAALEARPDNVALLRRAVNLSLETDQIEKRGEEFAERLRESVANNVKQQTWIAQTLFDYATETTDLDLLTDIASKTRHPLDIRARASRELIQLLAEEQNTGRLENEIRKYAKSFGYLHRGTSRDVYKNLEGFWKDVSGAYDSHQEAYEKLQEFAEMDIFGPDSALKELLNWELGRLAYELDKVREAESYFSGYRDDTDLAADCWEAYYQAAKSAGDKMGLVKMAATVGVNYQGDRWDRIKEEYVEGEIKAEIEEYAPPESASEAARDLYDLIVEEVKGADVDTLKKKYNGFLQDHAGNSREAVWGLLHLIRLVRTAEPSAEFGSYGRWLYGWADKIEDPSDQLRVLRAALDLFRDGDSISARPPIKQWAVTGPFPVETDMPLQEEHPPEDDPDVEAEYDVLKNNEGKTEKKGWQGVSSEQNGLLDVAPHFMRDEQVSAFAMTKIHSPEKQKVVLFVGFAGAGKLWLNDKEILSIDDPLEPFEPDAYLAEVELQKGENKLAVKTIQNEQNLKWGVSVRLARVSHEIEISILDKKQEIDPTPEDELYTWRAADRAVEIAPESEKASLLIRPYDILRQWGRTTEARGGYRALSDEGHVKAARKLVMSYFGWKDSDHDMADDYATEDKFKEKMNWYLDNYDVGARQYLMKYYLPVAEDEVERAFEHVNKYLKHRPGDWKVLKELWNIAEESDKGRNLGLEQALRLAKEYPEAVWLTNMALNKFRENL